MDGPWPIDPDPAATNLAARQVWHFAQARVAAVEVAGVTLSPGDPRLPFLGIRRGAEGRIYPARFAYDPVTGEPLARDAPAPEDGVLAVDPDSARDLALPGGVPRLVRAGRPEALYVLQENLGLLEWWDEAAGWTVLARLPVPDLDPPAHAVAAGPEGLAYATRDALVTVPLPQVAAPAQHVRSAGEGLRFLAGPARVADRLVAPADRAGGLALAALPLRAGRAAGPVAAHPLGAALPGRVAAPVADRLGDVFWPAEAGILHRPADGTADPRLTPWPDGFAPVLAQAPWRDRAGGFHQLGMRAGRYHYAGLGLGRLSPPLDGPHLAAGPVTYRAGECFAVPWEAAAEALTLGAYAGSLLVPLLALPRDTILLALRLEGSTAAAIRGEPFARPLTGYVLHHAHGAGLARLPASLEVRALGDAGAVLAGGTLHLYSRASGQCRRLAVRFR